MNETPTLDELPALVDEALRLVEARLATSPGSRTYDSIETQLTYVRHVVRGDRPRDAATDDKLLLGTYAARDFETSDPSFADLLVKVHHLYDHWPTTGTPTDASPSPAASPEAATQGAAAGTQRPADPQRSAQLRPRPRATGNGAIAFVLIGMLIMSVALLWPGIFFLVQRQTGVRAEATVGDCEVTGAGRYQRTHCTGTWIIGGSLLDGGHVVFGTINDADPSDVGKTIDVTLRGDEAYTLDMLLPLMLIGFGLMPIAIDVLLIWALVRRPRSNASKPG